MDSFIIIISVIALLVYIIIIREKIKREKKVEAKKRSNYVEGFKNQAKQMDDLTNSPWIQKHLNPVSDIFKDVSDIYHNTSKEESANKKSELFKPEEPDITTLLNKQVYNWPLLSNKLRYYAIHTYYPMNCDFEATQQEWDVRKLIWNFKYDPSKTTPLDHSKAMSDVLIVVKKILNETFGSFVSELTFVCIPASNKEINKLRYEEFSNIICESLNMTNAYPFIHIEKGKTPKHLGGTDSSRYSFDENFFVGRNVVLFDDIITRGTSMINMMNDLAKVKANVICGISIGKTKHIRVENEGLFIL